MLITDLFDYVRRQALHLKSSLAVRFPVACSLGLATLFANTAQAQVNIPQAAADSCAVMSGQRKADGRTLQYLLLLDQDLGDANPVALALYREVIKQCPKAYLNYHQRKKVNNPFPPGSLVKQNPTNLTNSTSDFPLRCHGAKGMASANGKNVIVNFERGGHAADQALLPGQCSWLDRGVHPDEPTRIAAERSSINLARKTAALINAGDTWTFWVVNAGKTFKATTCAAGTPSQKP